MNPALIAAKSVEKRASDLLNRDRCIALKNCDAQTSI